MSIATPPESRVESTAPVVPLLIGGKWQRPQTQEFNNVYNPSTGEVIGRTPMCGPTEIDAAVQTAKKAFVTWGETPAPKRAAVLFRFRELLTAHFDELVLEKKRVR